MTKHILLLHNGNTAVKSWAYSQYPEHTVMPCFTVDWPSVTEPKINFLKNCKNIICDITSADNIDYMDLCKLKDVFHIIKILSSHENDLDYLEDTWNKDTYDYTQWLQASLLRLCVADEVLYYNHITIPSIGSPTDPIIFTPGRCGTHVLREVAQISEFVHHNGNLISDPRFAKITNSSKIFSILRRNFFNFTLSQYATKVIGQTLITTSENLEKNKQIVDRFSPVDITEDEFVDRINSIAAFLDILLALHFLWKKEISLSYYEDLENYYDKIRVLKNPYTPKDLVKNYKDAVEFGVTYQVIYDQLFGLTNSVLKLAQF